MKIFTHYHNFFSVFCVVAIAFLSFNTTQGQWKQCNGPFGGIATMLTANDSSVFAVVIRDTYSNRDSISLFRSIDNGNTWVKLRTDFGKSPNRYMALITIENMLIAQFHDDIYCSTDNGDTWIRKPGYYDNSIISIGKVLYTWRLNGEFFSSTDYGASWTRISTTVHLPNAQYLYPTLLTLSSNGKDFISGTYDKGIFLSKDKGSTWTESNVGLTDLKVVQVAVSGPMLYASTKSGLFRSNDDGLTWTIIKTTPMSNWAPNNMLSVAGGTLFYKTEAGVYRSTDLGNSWIEIEKDIITNKIKPHIQIGKILFGISENGIFRSIDNGDTWISVGVVNQSVNSITKNGTTLFAGTNQNGVYRSIDNGLSWTSMNSSLTPSYTNVLYSYKDTLYLGTESGVYRNWNNVDTWKLWTMQNKPVNAFTSNGKTLFIGSDDYLFMYKSEKDTTGVWKSTIRLSSQNIRTLASYGSTIIAGINPYGIYRSTDDGDTWTMINTFSAKLIVVSGTTLFAITAFDNKVYSSTDNGETWAPLENLSVSATSIVVSGNTIFVGTNFRGIFSSTNNGDSWESVAENHVAPDAQTLFVDNGTLYVGSFLSSVWKLELPVAVEIQTEQEKSFSGLLCSPNPATNSLNIDHFSLLFNSVSTVHYTITSLTGEMLLETESAEPQCTISTEFLGNGVYYLTARQGLQRSSTLFSILH